jgi:hypothetical protein
MWNTELRLMQFPSRPRSLQNADFRIRECESQAYGLFWVAHKSPYYVTRCVCVESCVIKKGSSKCGLHEYQCGFINSSLLEIILFHLHVALFRCSRY